MLKRVLSIGDAMIDIVVQAHEEVNEDSDTQSSISLHGGGSAANVASWLTQVNIDSHFFGATGDDLPGAQFRDDLRSLGVVPHLAVLPDHKTGMVVVMVNGNGERTMYPDPGASSLTYSLELPSLDHCGAIFLSGYTLYKAKEAGDALSLLARLKNSRVPIFFDPASVGAMKHLGRETIRNFAAQADFLILNHDEANFISGKGDLRSALIDLGTITCNVVIKNGGNGAYAIDSQGMIFESQARHVSVVDTTGAGDAFAAGFIAAWLDNQSIQSALDAGNALAAECVAIIGARPRVITR